MQPVWHCITFSPLDLEFFSRKKFWEKEERCFQSIKFLSWNSFLSKIWIMLLCTVLYVSSSTKLKLLWAFNHMQSSSVEGVHTVVMIFSLIPGDSGHYVKFCSWQNVLVIEIGTKTRYFMFNVCSFQIWCMWLVSQFGTGVVLCLPSCDIAFSI